MSSGTAVPTTRGPVGRLSIIPGHQGGYTGVEKFPIRLCTLQDFSQLSQSTGTRGRGRMEDWGLSSQKTKDTVALGKFREQKELS
ncbi:hypothetical protein LAZ67_21000824 [Cordylochernes scorpioides]|uniref:Uncharacterized protein n=1 Tax=Cordylochernes scorpioides TaxID=51811 RepID=A0ABY6LPK0_9ARAC|nr:hypothetical protein LAZ67_21000824 [Cordylochernes scorpioides]